GINGTLICSANDGVHGQELGKSDGNASNTALVADVNLQGIGSYPHEFVGSNGTTFFTADDGSHGRELWKTDGTTAGTVLVKDINPGSDGSYPRHLEVCGSTHVS